MKQMKMKLLNMNLIGAVSLRSILVALSTLLVLAAVSFTLIGFVVAKDVTITDGEQTVQVTTARIYVEEVLAEQGITLRFGDRISMPLHSVLRQNDEIVIQRGKTIYLTDGGKTREIYSCAATLGEALNENGITLGAEDTVEPQTDLLVSEGLHVQIHRITVEEVVLDEVVAKKVIIRPNTEHPGSYSKVLSEGRDGLATVTYRITKKDGEEITREELSRVVHVEAVDEVIEKGIIGSKAVVASASDLQVVKSFECTATAYTDNVTCNGQFVGKTASGRKPAYGIVAVDPRVIPLGTKLYIESLDGSWAYGFAVAGDTGGAIKGKKIDLFYNTHAECIQFGRRSIRVYILE